MTRFDNIIFDEIALKKAADIKAKLVDLEAYIDENIGEDFYRDKARNSLEVAFMWIGKALRDEQRFTRERKNE